MSNSISIAYPAGGTARLEVHYAIEQTGTLQTINCSVEGNTFPIWLQLRKFTLSSRREVGGYVPLFNELNNSKNMDTSLFIDLVYSSIMTTERFKCS